MKIVCFQAVLFSLLFSATPAIAQYAPSQPYGNTQYLSPSPTGPRPTTTMGQAPMGQAYTSQNGAYQGYPAVPPQNPDRSRYPLIPPANPGMTFSPQPAYTQADRHAIQQPQYYPPQAHQSPPVPRAFAQPNQAPGYGEFNQPPYVANRNGLNGYGIPSPYGYRQDEAPQQEPPVSPSELPIPGGNNGDSESLAPAVEPGQGSIMNGQQPAPYSQHPSVDQYGQPYGQPYAHPHAQPNAMLNPGVQQPFGLGQGWNGQGTGLGFGPAFGGVGGFGPGGVGVGGFGLGGVGVGVGGVGGFGGGFAAAGQVGNAPWNLCQPCCCAPRLWYGSLGGLVFNRDFEDDHVFAYPFGMPLTNSLVSTEADPGAMGGVEAIIGRRFCNNWGIEAVYWGLFSDEGVSTAIGGNPQNNWATANFVDYHLSTMDFYLNSAAAFQIRRTNEFHNIELNLLRYTVAGSNFGCSTCGLGQGGGFGAGMNCGGAGCGQQGCGSCQAAGCCGPRRGWFGRPFRLDLLAGVRFFRFDENFFFRTSMTGDFMPDVNDIHYDLDVDNNLVGFQLGGNIEYCLFPRWSLVGGTRFGIYGNSITQRQRIYGLAGYAMPNMGHYTGQDYNLRSTKTDVAFLSQLDLGLRYAITCNWSLGFGYRVIAVNGVALAPEQIPYDFSHYQEANFINSNSGLILHGAYLRVGYNF